MDCGQNCVVAYRNTRMVTDVDEHMVSEAHRAHLKYAVYTRFAKYELSYHAAFYG